MWQKRIVAQGKLKRQVLGKQRKLSENVKMFSITKS
jgi:hypothetical protein